MDTSSVVILDQMKKGISPSSILVEQWSACNNEELFPAFPSHGSRGVLTFLLIKSSYLARPKSIQTETLITSRPMWILKESCDFWSTRWGGKLPGSCHSQLFALSTSIDLSRTFRYNTTGIESGTELGSKCQFYHLPLTAYRLRFFVCSWS